MSRIIHFVQNLSLDITAGAVISSLFLAQLFGVELTQAKLVGLAIAIWLIYTFDHLRDAYKAEGAVINPRHAFHQQYFKSLVGISLVVFALGLYNLQFLPEPTLRLGFVLVGLTSLYFLYLIYSKKAFSKEIFAATVYVAGIATAPISLLQNFKFEYLLILFIFWLLALSNLFLIPLFEEDLDKAQDEGSVVRHQGRYRVQGWLPWILGLSFLINLLYLFLAADIAGFLVFTAMHLALAMLLVKPLWFEKYQLYRIISDGIFFLPGLLLL